MPTIIHADWRIEPWCQYPRYGRDVTDAATFAADYAYHSLNLLWRKPTGELAHMKIGKPTHATGVHPGTRIESRFGSTIYHCPCGFPARSLARMRDHVQRIVATKYWPTVCAVNVASAAAYRARRMASMTDAQLAAFLAGAR